MPTPPLSPDLLREAVEAFKANGFNKTQAAIALGIDRGTYNNRYRRAIALGFDEKILSEAPAGHSIKGISTLYDAAGNVAQQWVKTRVDQISLEEVTEAILGAFGDHISPAPVLPSPDATEANLATIYPLADWHIGLLAWHKETGEDWDLNIAKDVISQAMRRLIATSPASEQAVVLGLGDLLHADNYQNRTSRSGNVLDVDGRYPKVLKVATELILKTIDLALQKHARVLVRLIPGNHDDQSAIAVSLALAVRFAGHPRVTVDDSASRFWWWRFGKVFLGAAHGDMAKMQDLPLTMAARNPDDWGASRHRLILTGHIHHRSKLLAAKEYGGVEVESFNTPVAKDAYQDGAGFASGRSVHSLTFHSEDGELSRSRVNIVTA